MSGKGKSSKIKNKSVDKKGAGKGAFSGKTKRKVERKERGGKFEDIEKMKGSVENLLQDLFY